MSDRLGRVRAKQEEARSYRKKGDALQKIGRENAAREAFSAGAAALGDALELLKPEATRISATTPPLHGDLKSALDELVETFGARGGMLQRLGSLSEAARSYSQGATLEDDFTLPSTYNRLNAIKYSLLAGQARLRELTPRIETLATFIEAGLPSNSSLSDSGWAWADLGDCMALLGKVEEARRAYATFIAKAEVKSPERTLDILKEIAAKLEGTSDPDASRLRSAIDALQSGLARR
jgi:tetratricopeptide (TPR) repeat protein